MSTADKYREFVVNARAGAVLEISDDSFRGHEDVALMRMMTDKLKELILEGKMDTTVRTRLRFLLESQEENTMVVLAGYIHKLMNNPIIKNKIMGEV